MIKALLELSQSAENCVYQRGDVSMGGSYKIFQEIFRLRYTEKMPNLIYFDENNQNTYIFEVSEGEANLQNYY